MLLGRKEQLYKKPFFLPRLTKTFFIAATFFSFLPLHSSIPRSAVSSELTLLRGQKPPPPPPPLPLLLRQDAVVDFARWEPPLRIGKEGEEKDPLWARRGVAPAAKSGWEEPFWQFKAEWWSPSRSSNKKRLVDVTTVPFSSSSSSSSSVLVVRGTLLPLSIMGLLLLRSLLQEFSFPLSSPSSSSGGGSGGSVEIATLSGRRPPFFSFRLKLPKDLLWKKSLAPSSLGYFLLTFRGDDGSSWCEAGPKAVAPTTTSIMIDPSSSSTTIIIPSFSPSSGVVILRLFVPPPSSDLLRLLRCLDLLHMVLLLFSLFIFIGKQTFSISCSFYTRRQLSAALLKTRLMSNNCIAGVLRWWRSRCSTIYAYVVCFSCRDCFLFAHFSW